MVGKIDKNYLNYLKKIIYKYKIKDLVHFVGPKKQEELRDYYINSYMVVVPSEWVEQFGIVGLEALACSTPVVGSNVGGIPEWLKDKKNGLLFERGNIQDLKEKIIFLLENPEKAEKYGKKGRLMVEKRFSKEKHIKKLIKIYKKLLSKNTSLLDSI
ncbi:MAG: glycosyltransferase family 4 protein [Candidatus Pacearchaeota archaeon]|nr:glycosyltransferase family 4 protein [Candidatus Pacearchaeota archaeon]